MAMGRDGTGTGILSSIPYPDSLTYPDTHTQYPTDLSLLSHPRTRRVSGIPDPVPYPIQIRKIFFCKKNIKKLILEKIN